MGVRRQPALLDNRHVPIDRRIAPGFVKLGLKEAATATEHDLHVSGVLLAGKHHEGAKLLHKALDRRHRVAINQFARSKSTDEVRALWQEAVQRGEIPGATGRL